MKLGCLNEFFNVKALVGTFNQEKAHDCETLNFAKGRSKLWLGGCGWVLLAGGVSGNPSIYFSFVLSGS